MTTIAALQNKGTKLREANYRRLRATTVLASHSHAVEKLQDPKLDRALARLAKENFDMERISTRDREYFFAYFDEKLESEIISEFRWTPTLGSIRNLGAREGYCSLCGKGDSLIERENRDKLRYIFRLDNTAGGKELWVGSSCILHHGLHVDGARTAEEAERLLKKSFNAHKKQWEIEMWRASTPGHEEIPELWNTFRWLRIYNVPWENFGLDRYQALREWRRLMGALRDGSRNHFKGAVRQYMNRGALTPGKEQAWRDAKQFVNGYNALTELAQGVSWQDRKTLLPSRLEDLRNDRRQRADAIALHERFNAPPPPPIKRSPLRRGKKGK